MLIESRILEGVKIFSVFFYILCKTFDIIYINLSKNKVNKIGCEGHCNVLHDHHYEFNERKKT